MKDIKLNTRLLLYLFGLFIATGCTDILSLDLDDPEPVVVVDGFISTIDTIQEVKLSVIQNYFANTPPDYTLYKNAVIHLRENEIEVGKYVFNPSNERFELQYKGLEGKGYQVHIVFPDGTSYLSKSEMMKDIVPIDRISVDVISGGFFDNPEADSTLQYAIFVGYQDPANVPNFYQWKTYSGETYFNEVTDIVVRDDAITDGAEIKKLNIFTLPSGSIPANSNTPANSINKITVEQINVSDRYYKYVSLIRQQIVQVGYPYAPPPAEIIGNVDQVGKKNVQALGYFYTAAISRAYVEVDL